MNDEPRIRVTQLSAVHHREPGIWDIAWEVENIGTESICLLAVRLPHGQFKSDELSFNPAIGVTEGKPAQFTIVVRCHEPHGLVTENAFLIFQALWHEEAWRLFVRVSVVVDEKGIPAANVESITTQRVGFSGITS